MGFLKTFMFLFLCSYCCVCLLFFLYIFRRCLFMLLFLVNSIDLWKLSFYSLVYRVMYPCRCVSHRIPGPALGRLYLDGRGGHRLWPSRQVPQGLCQRHLAARHSQHRRYTTSLRSTISSETYWIVTIGLTWKS